MFPRSLRFPLLYLLIALAWSWPLPLHLSTRFTFDPGDPLLVTYLVWWNAHAVPFTQRFWNAPFFWPMPGALALTEHLAGLSPVTTPVQWLGGSPLLACNLALIASAWWTALATHALVKRLTASTAAAVCGALAFAYAPYHVSQGGHLQLFACWWMPLALLGLHAYKEDRRPRWLVLFGISSLLQSLTNGYAALFFPVLVGAWVVWFTPWRTSPRMAAGIGAAWVLSTLPLVPFLLEYYRVQTSLGLARSRSEMAFYSADWSAFLSASPLMRFWHTAPPRTTEDYLFPGVTIVVLIIVGAAMRLRSRTFVFYVALAVFTAALSFGPSATPSIASLWHPYDWLAWLPGFSGLRVPPRFYLLTVLCLAIAAALAFAHVAAHVKRVPLLLAIVLAGLTVDGAIAGMPLGVPPGRLDYREAGAHLLALPFDDSSVSVRAMYQSMTHRMPVVNGYAGYIPPHADVIQWALRRRDPTLLTELRRGHPLVVFIAPSEDTSFWQSFIASQPGVEDLGVRGGGRVYRLPPAAYAPEIATGPAIQASVTMTRDALVTDLGGIRDVDAVQLRTYGYLTRLPASVHVEVSTDGAAWQTVSDERPGGAALLGALREPRTIPLTVTFPPVRARFVRANTPQLGPKGLLVFGG